MMDRATAFHLLGLGIGLLVGSSLGGELGEGPPSLVITFVGLALMLDGIVAARRAAVRSA